MPEFQSFFKMNDRFTVVFSIFQDTGEQTDEVTRWIMKRGVSMKGLVLIRILRISFLG